MGNKIRSSKPPTDCYGPGISNNEIKQLTYIGFTIDEINEMNENDKQKKLKTMMTNGKKIYPK